MQQRVFLLHYYILVAKFILKYHNWRSQYRIPSSLRYRMHISRAVARTLIGGGGVYSYIQVLPDWLLLKSTSFQKKLIGHDLNIWIYTPPLINALATALHISLMPMLNREWQFILMLRRKQNPQWWRLLIKCCCNKTIRTSFRLGMIIIRTQLSKDKVQVLFYNEMRKHR